ncbi:MAG: DUF4293 domain-containing protein [Bacteroidetes bacterium]|nr:DUF4293 domain-containing protein [Bacteroidota bacterium]
MIQRIQTLWFFLASLLSASMLLDWYTGYVYKADIPEGFGLTVKRLTIVEHFPSLIIVVVMIVVPLIAIFSFRNRRRQRNLASMGMFVNIAFLSVNLMRINAFTVSTAPTPINGSYQLGSVIPVIVLFILFMAARAVYKDEKLVKSMDRLR